MNYAFAALTAGGMSPSARFRVRQFIEPLRKAGFELKEFSSGWRGHTQSRSCLDMLGNYAVSFARNLANTFTARRYDGVLIQRWAMGSFPTTEFLAGRPRVWDIDDAIWLNAPARVIRYYAASFDLVICGNSFLAEKVSQWNPAVKILPTAVDTDRFRPGQTARCNDVICWSGSRSNLKYLNSVSAAIAAVFEANPHASLRVVCDQAPNLPGVEPAKVQYIPWSPEAEVSALQTAAVSIMPLDDTEWCRGKCSYKMLCSLACGLPVVASPVGMNAEVLSGTSVGLAATSTDDWVGALNWILNHPVEAGDLGRNGRNLAESRYSVRVVTPQLSDLLGRLAG